MNPENEFTNPNRYQELADRTKCSQSEAVDRLAIHSPNSKSIGAEPNPNAIQLLHSVVGLTGEVGELSTALEKWIWYGQPFDKTNIKEELGDILWYLAELHNAIGVSMLETMRANIRKLQTRYPEKYDWEKCKEENRDRVAEANAVDSVMQSEDYVPAHLQSDRKESSYFWEGYFNTQVKDSDGWRRDDLSFDDPITALEFARRWVMSTCKGGGNTFFKTLLQQLKMKPKEVEPVEQTGQGFAEPPLDEEEILEPNMAQRFKHDPVFTTGKMWYHYTENWADYLGPFNTELEARASLVKYTRLLDGANIPEVEPFELEPPKDGFEVARDIANSFIEGQNREHAIKTINQLEKIYDDYTGDNL